MMEHLPASDDEGFFPDKERSTKSHEKSTKKFRVGSWIVLLGESPTKVGTLNASSNVELST